MEIQDNDFEYIFSELLDQSKVFTIKYNPKPFYYKEDAFMDYTIVGVNDCGSEWEFKARYRALIKAGMSKLSSALGKESHDGKIGLLEYIYEEFSALKITLYRRNIPMRKRNGDRKSTIVLVDLSKLPLLIILAQALVSLFTLSAKSKILQKRG